MLIHACSHAQVFFAAILDGLPPLRGAFGDVYEPKREVSPRYTNLWRTTHSASVKGVVLIDVEVHKLAVLAVSSTTPESTRVQTGLRGGDVFACTVQAQMFPNDKQAQNLRFPVL